MAGIELKQFVNDEEFIDKMNKAFLDLRADYELTMDFSQEKIHELLELHVDVNNHLSDLVAWSRRSSGTICGLRGTGKTHLMLLARHKLNETLWVNDTDNNLCIYLNMKRLCLPSEFDRDLFNRIFSIFIYEEMASQLMIVLKKLGEKTLLQRLISFFDKKDKNLQDNLQKALVSICSMSSIAHNGNEEFRNIGTGNFEKETANKELYEIAATINTSMKELIPDFEIAMDEHMLLEMAEQLKLNNTYIRYLNIQSVRKQMLEIISILGIDSITFYVDEWEKISAIPNCQDYSASYIDKVMDDPLYFWIGIVPYRGGLYCLDNGADLQHQINLDESLIFETSESDKSICVSYFKELVNKRLYFYFGDAQYDYRLMFNSDENFSKLVLASMGNTRDFGTMLLKCWSEYQAYRKAQLAQGRPFKYISSNMIVSAIKDNGDKKYSNIESDRDVVKAWNDIKSYCLSKKSSHFAIEEKVENLDCLREKEFSELIYHRLMHLRKSHVPAKDNDVEDKLTIYAINYAATYTLHAQDRKLTFIQDYKLIHDRVRRYIYNPQAIIEKLRIENGSLFPCKGCRMQINPQKMKFAWDKNSCPFCGGEIY